MSQNLDRLKQIARQLAQRARSNDGAWANASPLDGQLRFIGGHFEAHKGAATPTLMTDDQIEFVFSDWWVTDIVNLKHSDPDACRRLCGQIGLDTHQLGLD